MEEINLNLEDINEDILNDIDFEEEEMGLSVQTPKTVDELISELKLKGKEVPVDLTDMDVLKYDMSNIHARRLNDILLNSTDSEFTKIYLKIIDYFKPKLKAIEGEEKTDKPNKVINVQIINNINQNKE